MSKFKCMNMDLKVFYDIAKYVGMDDMASLIDEISIRSQQANCDLILPLVGEFSSGKTTLINALTDSKKLETATKPTTATIYRIHFGCDKSRAKVLDTDEKWIEYSDIAELKNDKLGNAVMVDIFDTSLQVPSTTILVDTPGLSSSDPRHRQALVNFLPQADAILLVTDVNQQLTRSITDFVRTMELAQRPIFLIITKCDTKSTQDLAQVRKYISDNIQLPIQQIVCVSAVKDDMQELFSLFNNIQSEKADIIKQVDAARIQNVAKSLLIRIEELLESSSSDKKLENAIHQQEMDLKQLKRNIEHLVNEVSCDVEEVGRKLVRLFEDTVSARLEALVAGNSGNFDAEAISVINNTSSLLLNDYRNEIQHSFRKKANESQRKEDAVSLQSLKELDLSSLSIAGLNYNLNLNALGHQYDNAIAMATKVVVAAGAVYAGAGGEIAAANILDAADTATDVMSIHSNNKTANRIEKTVSFVEMTTDKMSSIDRYNQMAGQQMGADKGIVESMVGFVTDKTMGKPQRKRAIHNYMDETLVPGFKSEMKRINNLVISSVVTMLHQEAIDTIAQKKSALEQLQKEYNEQKAEYEKRITQLRDYRTLLVTL